MKPLTKGDVYSKLISIEEKNNIDVSNYINEIVRSKSIPYSALIFINRYSPIDMLETYNIIYSKRRKNPLYKNLVNENLPVQEQAIALSSLLTQSLIGMKSLNETDKKLQSTVMNISLISEALHEYSLGDSSKLEETFSMIREVFKKLYSKDI